MSNMSTGIHASRRNRRPHIVGSILAAVLLLAGCSADGEDSAPADYASMNSDANWSGDAATESRAMEEQAAGEDSSAPQPISDNRSMIITGELYMTVEDPIAAAREATTIVQNTGGRIDARHETAADEYDGGSAWLTLRIPAAELETVVQDLGELGDVDDYNTNSVDVSHEVTDLEAQISTLRASTARIEALLDQASDISDIIDLETELANRQGRLEGLEARQRGLDDQVSMSTIELSLTTEPIVEVKDDPNSFWDGLVAGWNGLVSFGSGALVVLGVLLPWLAVLAIIAFAIILIVRASSKRKHNRLTEANHATHVQPTPPGPRSSS